MHGLTLTNKINESCEKKTSIGWVYPVLGRLEMQGLVSSRLDPSGPEGKQRKLFKATREGGTKLRNSTSQEIEDYRNQGDWGLAY
jgi:DNA-binding PadR family transcriptional regulator